MIIFLRRFLLVFGMLLLSGCGGGGTDTGTTTPPTVSTPTLSSLAISPAGATIILGTTQQLVATGTYSDGSTADLTQSANWVSSGAGVTVGAATGLAKAVAVGTQTITATVGAVVGSTTLTVKAATLSSVTISPADATIAFGTTQQLTATGSYTDGSAADLTKSVKWASSGAGVTVGAATGLATSVSVGTQTITATMGTVVGSTTLTVKAAFTTVASGGYHTLALKSDGSLFAWGKNLAGQLGDSTNTDRLIPTQVGTVKTWVKIAAGEFHSMAIRSDGTLWAWGLNLDGQLGDGTQVNRPAPVKIGSDATWVAVAAGKTHTVALKKDGTLWAWGNNDRGQLGVGSITPYTAPRQVGVTGSFFKDWTAVSAGGTHTLARRADGTLWSWGGNTNGQLGLGDTTDVKAPTQIGPDSSNRWVMMAAGGDHSLAIRSDHALFAWGSDSNSQLGIEPRAGDVLVPTLVLLDDNQWAAVVAGYQHNLATKFDGSLWVWGANGMGQLGDSTVIDKSRPTRIGADTDWLSVSPGKFHSFAFKTDGSLWHWGSNAEGQLGNGTLVTPVLVPTVMP